MSAPIFIKVPMGLHDAVININYIVECYVCNDKTKIVLSEGLEAYKLTPTDTTPADVYTLIEEAKEREENRLAQRLEERGF